MTAAIINVPASGAPPACDRNRAAACTTTPAGSQHSASAQNARGPFHAFVSMPQGCTLGGGGSTCDTTFVSRESERSLPGA